MTTALTNNWRKVRQHWWFTPLAIFLGVRLGIFIFAWLAMPGDKSAVARLTTWDANWNVMVAEDGYTMTGQPGIATWAKLAFFPLLPYAARFIAFLTPLSIPAAGLIVSTVFGAIGIVVLWRVIERRYKDKVATKSVLLLIVWPSAFVFSMFYTESLMLMCVAVVFLALDKKQWLLAGTFALIGGAARPNGFLLIVPCAVAAFMAIRETKSLKPLIAPLLAPIGFILWLVFVWRRTGIVNGYFEIQNQVWMAKVDFGYQTLRSFKHIAEGKVHDWDTWINAIGLIVMGGLGTVLVLWKRMNPVWTSWTVALVAITFANARQASSPRFLLMAFPIFVAFVLALPKKLYPPLVVVSAVTMLWALYQSAGWLLFTP